jgi:hypothetical protein
MHPVATLHIPLRIVQRAARLVPSFRSTVPPSVRRRGVHGAVVLDWLLEVRLPRGGKPLLVSKHGVAVERKRAGLHELEHVRSAHKK